MDLSHSIQPSLLTTFQLKHCGCCERCEKQIVAAEREFGAFVMAVHILFGKAEAAHAAECWIELVEEDKTSFADGFPKLAASHGCSRQPAFTRTLVDYETES